MNGKFSLSYGFEEGPVRAGSPPSQRQSRFLLMLMGTTLLVGCQSGSGPGPGPEVEFTAEYSACGRLTHRGNFKVTNGHVPTGLRLDIHDRITLVATGEVDFGGGLFGLPGPTEDADGAIGTDGRDPAPDLRHNSLIYRVGDGGWHQGSRSTVPGEEVKLSGELVLGPNDFRPEDNSGLWVVNVFVIPGNAGPLSQTVDADCDGLLNAEEATSSTNRDDSDSDDDGLFDGAEVHGYRFSPTSGTQDGRADFHRVHSEYGGLWDDPNRRCSSIRCPYQEPVVIGDNFTDGDHDGVSDAVERVEKTDPSAHDTDGDLLSDGEEMAAFKTNPRLRDTDFDGIGDGEEVRRWASNPKKRDTDCDVLQDALEVAHVTNPREPDSDRDGLRDYDEIFFQGTSPRKADSDGDGVNDKEDNEPPTAIPVPAGEAYECR